MSFLLVPFPSLQGVPNKDFVCMLNADTCPSAPERPVRMVEAGHSRAKAHRRELCFSRRLDSICPSGSSERGDESGSGDQIDLTPRTGRKRQDQGQTGSETPTHLKVGIL
jgi:hypothetical protein